MLKVKILLFVLLVSIGSIVGQTQINRVWLRSPRQYMVNVLTEVVKTIEERHWWNLKLKDIEYNINENIFSRNYTGTVTYKNGFLVSIQHLDILSSSLMQLWNTTNGQLHVYTRGTLRMTDVTLGYDIEADLEDGKHHYTGTITHPLYQYEFWVCRTVVTHEMWTRVFGTLIQSGNIAHIMPSDHTSDALTTMFNVRDTIPGLEAWTEQFAGIAEDVIRNRVPYPNMCYNCPVPTD